MFEEVNYISICVEPRYWEDAIVNGIKEDEDNPKIPFKAGKSWNLNIDATTGKIHNWPEGVTARVHYKVCDAGWYRLYTREHSVVSERYDYVPDFLCPTDNGYGDYIIMKIDEQGFIEGWKKPRFDESWKILFKKLP